MGFTLTRTVEVLRRRVDQLGVSEPNLQRSGDDRVIIELPGVADPDEALEVIAVDDGSQDGSFLALKTEAEMLKYRNFGKKSLNEIKEKLSSLGLALGMNIDPTLLESAKEEKAA